MLTDTAPERELRYHQLLAAMSPGERLQKAVVLSRTVRRLSMAGLRARHPELDDQELLIRLAVILYGRQVADRLFARVPSDAR